VLPTPTGGDVLNGDPHNPTRWDDSPDIVIDTTGAVRITPPTEVELAKIPAAGPATDRARVSTTNRQVKVHVLVHHRWSDSLPSAQVKVALLRQVLPANGVVPISLLWPALVTAAPSAVEPTSLPDGWTKAAATLWQSPSDGIDSRVPRAVTFDVDLSAESSGSVVAFLAVVMSLPDQIDSDDLSLGGANTAQPLTSSSRPRRTSWRSHSRSAEAQGADQSWMPWPPAPREAPGERRGARMMLRGIRCSPAPFDPRDGCAADADHQEHGDD
jgi:hypothetical protein